MCMWTMPNLQLLSAEWCCHHDRQCRCGWGPTGCSYIHQRLRICGAHLVNTSIRYFDYATVHCHHVCAATFFHSEPWRVHWWWYHSANTWYHHCQNMLHSTSADAVCGMQTFSHRFMLWSSTRSITADHCWPMFPVIFRTSYRWFLTPLLHSCSHRAVSYEPTLYACCLHLDQLSP